MAVGSDIRQILIFLSMILIGEVFATPVQGQAHVEEMGPHEHTAPPQPKAGQKRAEAEQQQAPKTHQHKHVEPTSEPSRDEVGVDERLGKRLPLDLIFIDEDGQQFRLGEFIDKPTLILPVFFNCTQSCNLMLGNLASGINKIPLDFGEEYKALAVSFDHEEGAQEAHKSKINYINILGSEFEPENWKFLTGDAYTVRAFTEAIGFRFKKLGLHSFIHPNILIAVAPDGTIIRYLYGPRFLPFDMGMALTEAAKGTPGLTVRKLLTYCFAYEPESKSYSFKFLRISAVAILLLLIIFFVWLLKRKPATKQNG